MHSPSTAIEFETLNEFDSAYEPSNLRAFRSCAVCLRPAIRVTTVKGPHRKEAWMCLSSGHITTLKPEQSSESRGG